MLLRRLITCAAATLVSAVVAGCGSADDPYEALSERASEFVIPNSDEWTSGELCPDGGDCSGPITVDTIRDLDWLRTTAVAVNEAEGSVEASLSVTEVRGSFPVNHGTAKAVVWGPDVDEIRTVLGGDYEVWTGVDADNDLAMVFVAFDREGRFAAVGNAAAEYFTVPVAELTAEADAPSGRAFIEPLMHQ